jgi:23S rRNA pseudouridine1911/1915/1917 synthase
MRLLTLIVSQIDEKKKSKRADQWISAQNGMPSRSQIKSWFAQGRIKRRGEILEPSDPVFEGDELSIDVPDLDRPRLEARALDFQVFYEDSELLVLYKERGLSMHPGASSSEVTTLAHALVAYSAKLSDRGGEFRPGIVHRLDKDTEGLVVVAKNNEAHEYLSKQFAARSITRTYWALCRGQFPDQLEVEAPIGRHPTQRKKMAIVEKGRSAKSLFRCLARFPEGYSWIQCRLETGRTHQIRVHLAHKKFPILNDPVYGAHSLRGLKLDSQKEAELNQLQGQALIAYELGFEHPKTKERLLFQAGMPNWLRCLTH